MRTEHKMLLTRKGYYGLILFKCCLILVDTPPLTRTHARTHISSAVDEGLNSCRSNPFPPFKKKFILRGKATLKFTK